MGVGVPARPGSSAPLWLTRPLEQHPRRSCRSTVSRTQASPRPLPGAPKDGPPLRAERGLRDPSSPILLSWELLVALRVNSHDHCHLTASNPLVSWARGPGGWVRPPQKAPPILVCGGLPFSPRRGLDMLPRRRWGVGRGAGQQCGTGRGGAGRAAGYLLGALSNGVD